MCWVGKQRWWTGGPSLARPERFVPSCQVLVSKPDSVLEKITIDDETVFLLMTHNYNYDLAMLKALLKKNVAYIGSLGPRQKMDRMLEEIREEGIHGDAKRAIGTYLWAFGAGNWRRNTRRDRIVNPCGDQGGIGKKRRPVTQEE